MSLQVEGAARSRALAARPIQQSERRPSTRSYPRKAAACEASRHKRRGSTIVSSAASSVR